MHNDHFRLCRFIRLSVLNVHTRILVKDDIQMDCAIIIKQYVRYTQIAKIIRQNAREGNQRWSTKEMDVGVVVIVWDGVEVVSEQLVLL